MSREVVKVVEKFDADEIALNHINASGTDESFFIVNIGDVVQKFKLWHDLMPRIHPDFAYKCNNHVNVAGTLAILGAGFDCASMGEISQVLAMGVPPSKIVFAQTVKPVSHITFAKKNSVDMMTFDNEEELYKAAKHFSEAKLLLRLRFDPKSIHKISFGDKFGATVKTGKFLLERASELGLNIYGVAFHIGIGCLEYEIFETAIRVSGEMFEYGKSLGHRMKLLDIGGGFPGHEIKTITGVSKTINESLEKYFSDESIKVISEPGTYFAEKSFTLYANVHSKTVKINENGEEVFHYYITDGVYQSFNMISAHGYSFAMRPLKKYPGKALKKSVIWGRACDPQDIVMHDVLLPEMACGDWLVFDDAGAYRISTSTTFNGFPNHEVHSFIERKDWETLKKMKVPHIDFLYDVVE